MGANPTIKASRRSTINPFIVMEVMAAANDRARRGGDVLHLEIGEPGGGAPPAALEAVTAALAGGACGYTEAFGLPALRRALAERYRRDHRLAISPARIATRAPSGRYSGTP